MSNIKLIFVYNADSPPINQAVDFFHKIFSPQTYPCNLSKLTHDKFNMRPEWKSFVDRLSVDAKFYHRDMFKKKYPNAQKTYPIVFKEQNGNLTVLITPEEMNSYTKLVELMEAINGKLNK